MTSPVPFLVQPESWVAEAACAGHDRDLWFPIRDGPGRLLGEGSAREICRTCPVREACLDYALRTFTDRNDYGIWGGTSARQRKRLRRTARADGARR